MALKAVPLVGFELLAVGGTIDGWVHPVGAEDGIVIDIDCDLTLFLDDLDAFVSAGHECAHEALVLGIRTSDRDVRPEIGTKPEGLTCRHFEEHLASAGSHGNLHRLTAAV